MDGCIGDPGNSAIPSSLIGRAAFKRLSRDCYVLRDCRVLSLRLSHTAIRTRDCRVTVTCRATAAWPLHSEYYILIPQILSNKINNCRKPCLIYFIRHFDGFHFYFLYTIQRSLYISCFLIYLNNSRIYYFSIQRINIKAINSDSQRYIYFEGLKNGRQKIK